MATPFPFPWGQSWGLDLVEQKLSFVESVLALGRSASRKDDRSPSPENVIV